MSRGIVLWPDEETSATIRSVWDRLSVQGLPSMSTHTHRLHQPHVSLIVAEDLPVDAALRAVGSVPQAPIRLLVESVGVFPGGFFFMACVTNQALLDEQRRVYEAMLSLVTQPWPYFEPGTWTPHVTTGWALADEQLAAAVPMVLQSLPIQGWLCHGGVEDGTTGENWPSPTGAPRDIRGS